MLKIRKRLFRLLEGAERMGRILQASLMTLIALNVAAVLADSVQDLATAATFVETDQVHRIYTMASSKHGSRLAHWEVLGLAQ